MSNRLKPCPFCGGRAKLVTVPMFSYIKIGCIDCGSNSSIFDIDGDYGPMYDAWNTRTQGESNEQ